MHMAAGGVKVSNMHDAEAADTLHMHMAAAGLDLSNAHDADPTL